MMRRGLVGLWLLVWAGWSLVACRTPSATSTTPAATVVAPHAPLRVFWVNSYAAGDVSATQVRAGIFETLVRQGYTPGETLTFEAYHLDVHQYATLEAARETLPQIIAAIQAFGPDIVVVSDDEAAQLVIPAYPDATLPFVFCGVTGDPADYDLLRPNVTGVRELPRPVETVALARAFVEPATRYLILGDASPTGEILAQYVSAALQADAAAADAPELHLTSAWPEWQALITEAPAALNFILLLNFDSVLDEDGNYMDERAIMTWLVEHSPLPVFALSKQGVLNGAVGGLVTCGEEQGKAAGQLIIQIAQGQSPSALPIAERAGYRLAMNLAAARHWDLRIPVMLPPAADVYKTLPGAAQGGRP